MGIVDTVTFSRRFRLLVLSVAVLVAAAAQTAVAQKQPQTGAVTPYPLTSALPIVGDARDARANNLVVLDSIVFLLGVGILSGILIWWGLRIYKEK